VTVDVPAGVTSGSTKSVSKGGHRISPDGPIGELEVQINVAAHPFFEREGDNVLCRVPISLIQAVLGGEVVVPTLAGKAKLRVPPATQPGTVLRMRQKGVPHRVRSGSGDQLVQVNVEIPSQLTPRARELVEQLGRELGEDLQPQQRSFLEKLRSLFD
jgi:molecular chaperone DnaJ